MLKALAWQPKTSVGFFFALRQQNYANNKGIPVFLGETSDLSEERLIDRLNLCLSVKEKPQSPSVECCGNQSCRK